MFSDIIAHVDIILIVALILVAYKLLGSPLKYITQKP